jgi:hypothetical protein
VSNLDSPKFTGLCFSCTVAHRPMEVEQAITKRRKEIRARQVITIEQVEKQRKSILHLYKNNPEYYNKKSKQIASLSKSPDIIAKRVESRKGYSHSLETRTKIKQSLIKYWLEKNESR